MILLTVAPLRASQGAQNEVWQRTLCCVVWLCWNRGIRPLELKRRLNFTTLESITVLLEVANMLAAFRLTPKVSYLAERFATRNSTSSSRLGWPPLGDALA